jgi:sugar phosphate isomerase/epimerase
MKYSFATLGCPEWSLEKIAAEAKRMGYDGVELRASPDGNHLRPDEPAESCEKIRKLFADHGVSIACLMGYTNFAVADDDTRLKGAGTVESLVNTAASLGCPTVRIFGGDAKGEPLQAMVDRVVASLTPLAAKAERANVKLAFETHDAWCDPKNLMQVLDRVPSKALGICWDIANTSSRSAHDATWQAMKSRVVHVHAKDITGEKHQCVLAGTGDARLAEALAMLRRDGYNGFVSFEWEKKWQPTIPEPEVAFPAFIKFAKQHAA